LPVEPLHALVPPEIVPGIAGAEFIVTANVDTEEVPHAFVAVTVIFPAAAPSVTVADVVPCPAVIDEPAGTDQV
jgi:hypothetical protein